MAEPSDPIAARLSTLFNRLNYARCQVDRAVVAPYLQLAHGGHFIDLAQAYCHEGLTSQQALATFGRATYLCICSHWEMINYSPETRDLVNLVPPEAPLDLSRLRGLDPQAFDQALEYMALHILRRIDLGEEGC